MNIPPEAVASLVRLGYTTEEARFIYIVAIHSGYFTHRQFLQFSGTKPGKHSQKFLMKLLAENHATFHVYPSGGRVYHVFSRKVFNAIGHDDLRTRRKHELEYIKTRLVTLDFVLGNLECQYLSTEADKVPFLQEKVGISRSILPSKTYRSNRSARTTVRYFVDRFPIFLRDSGTGNPTLSFTYVDWGAPTLRGFLTHLESYATFLRSIGSFEFLFLAPAERFFRAVQVEFSRIVLASKETPSPERILRYFELREQWESGERVSATDVVFLNATGSELRSADMEQQYARWRDRLVKDVEVGVDLTGSYRRLKASFEARICGQSLSVFQRPNANYGETADEIVAPAFSRGLSPERLSPEARTNQDART